MLETKEENLYIIYDSTKDNAIVVFLSDDFDPVEHDSRNPEHIKISKNTINSPEGTVLYGHEVQVNSKGTASRVK